ncbi:Protein CBG26740 [Caenorhabditis briggsae]|uniref:Protein CBG26740 n=1 Tax=Caenorhabditis briggsae TaxID=6238 RepID=B6IEB5_CAEBR|nr:Protein CBG26740 [Caenorhabditis briggsae]CAS01179.1 Protein CBG26740 [Caenorhabditis briggsae]
MAYSFDSGEEEDWAGDGLNIVHPAGLGS